MTKSSFLLSLLSAMLAAEASNENRGASSSHAPRSPAAVQILEETDDSDAIQWEARRAIGRELTDD